MATAEVKISRLLARLVALSDAYLRQSHQLPSLMAQTRVRATRTRWIAGYSRSAGVHAPSAKPPNSLTFDIAMESPGEIVVGQEIPSWTDRCLRQTKSEHVPRQASSGRLTGRQGRHLQLHGGQVLGGNSDLARRRSVLDDSPRQRTHHLHR